MISMDFNLLHISEKCLSSVSEHRGFLNGCLWSRSKVYVTEMTRSFIIIIINTFRKRHAVLPKSLKLLPFIVSK